MLSAWVLVMLGCLSAECWVLGASAESALTRTTICYRGLEASH